MTKLLKISTIMMALCLMLTFNATAADTKATAPAMSETGKLQAAAIQPVNINKADVKTLTTLKGIGKDRAQRIVDYRENKLIDKFPFQRTMKLKNEEVL